MYFLKYIFAKMPFAFVLSIIMLFIASCGSNQSHVSKVLLAIPKEDRQVLSDFFSELINNNCFGQTLLGAKPVSFEHAFIAPPCGYDIFTSNRVPLFIWRAERVWNKYQVDFKLNTCLIKFHIKENLLTVFLIHKPAFLEAVRSNISIFKSILGEDVSPESLFEIIINKDMDFHTAINDNVILEGILLGFGAKNATLYQRYNEVFDAFMSPLPPPWIEDLNQGGVISTIGSPDTFNRKWRSLQNIGSPNLRVGQNGFNTIKDEYDWFRKKYRNGSQLRSVFHPISRFRIPMFLIDDQDDEVKQVILKYNETRKRLSKMYSEGDFLEITLRKMAGEI